jgi:hypothetical protein
MREGEIDRGGCIAEKVWKQRNVEEHIEERTSRQFEDEKRSGGEQTSDLVRAGLVGGAFGSPFCPRRKIGARLNLRESSYTGV